MRSRGGRGGNQRMPPSTRRLFGLERGVGPRTRCDRCGRVQGPRVVGVSAAVSAVRRCDPCGQVQGPRVVGVSAAVSAVRRCDRCGRVQGPRVVGVLVPVSAVTGPGWFPVGLLGGRAGGCSLRF